MKYKMNHKKKRILIIGILCVVLMLMASGYAAFNSMLNISGTSNITSNWDVRITSVQEKNKGGNAETVGTPTWTELTAMVETDLFSKGDFVEYEVTVENRGTLDAKLESISEDLVNENQAAKISFSGYTKGEKLAKGTSTVIVVKIEYNPEFTGNKEEGSTEIKLDLNYSQNDDYKQDDTGEIISPDRYLVTYDCTTNGGNSCTKNNEYLREGDLVNLNFIGEKDGYKFVGWNTDKDAKEPLTELTMTAENVTLYAIYKAPEPPIIDKVSTSTTTNSITIVVAAHDELGISKYEYSIDGEHYIESTDNIYTFTGLRTNANYIIFIKVTNKYGITTEYNKKIEINSDYNGEEQTFTVPVSGTYKLEVWGAQGGYAVDATQSRGGYGAYATGNITLNEGDILYINVGGQGNGTTLFSTPLAGGYNGGGGSHSNTDTVWGSGGGATHIATKSGLLKNLSSDKDSILIVAGAGGGGGYYQTNRNQGADAGGIIGSNGNGTDPGNGGNQTTGGNGGGSNIINGGFGYGGGNESNLASGGGSGYYGGGTGFGNGSSAGGGSSYIGNPLLTNKVMYCYDCTESNEESTKTISTTDVSEIPTSNQAKEGNGFAKIAMTNLNITTKKIELPTFSEEQKGEEKEITITYPEGCGDSLTCSYQKDGEEWIEATDINTKIVFTESGVVVAKVTDGTNEATSSYNAIFEGNTLEYNGEVQTFTADKDGYYKIELWGAQGGSISSINGGNGAYTSGEIYLHQGDNLYIYIGGQGQFATTDNTRSAGGFNGGGQGYKVSFTYPGTGGGGATDIRLTNGNWNDETSLNSRIMVAAGGGGLGYANGGSAGGTLLGTHFTNGSTGGLQTSGGTPANLTNKGTAGGFGFGGDSGAEAVGGGGSGYYGGAGASQTSGTNIGAPGGSSYISGYAGVNSITSETDRTHTNQTKHYSGKYFINTEMRAGVNSGNGKAKITYLKAPTSEDSTKIKGVRYIKDCINGNTVDTNNLWLELQAINKGINVAKGKTITGTSTAKTNYPYLDSINGIIDNLNKYGASSDVGLQCITVDLEQEYDLEEIAVWHYYGDGRTYNNNTTQVAGEDEDYRVIYNEDKAETSNGNRIRKDWCNSLILKSL